MTATQERLPQLDLFALGGVADPYALYAQWRQAGPLMKAGPGQWGVTRHAEVSALLKDRRLVHHMPREYLEFVMGNGPSADFRQNSLLNRDGPDHQRLRRLMSQAFTPAFVRSLD